MSEIPVPPLRIVLDTNAALDLWVFRDPLLAPLADWQAAGRIELLKHAEKAKQ